ncbi:hypothetical protein [Psychrobacter sp. NPDC077938]|uniref:hypothetical protein n=1 Tax=Psychrobacter sp. NPDC077938 TaxID=3364494 RepID=UPI0037CA20E9
MKKLAPFSEMVGTSNPVINSKEFPSVKTKVNKLSNIDADTVYKYLINGIEVIEFLSPDLDIIDSKITVRTKVFTDGCYLWTMMIPHLVKNYKVSLPEEFMHYLRKQNTYANQYDNGRIKQILDSLKGKKIDSYVKFSDDE